MLFRSKVPEMILKNEQGKVKGLMNYAIKIKIAITSLFMIGYIIAALILNKNNPDSPYPILILIQCQIILFVELRIVFATLINAMKLFRSEAMIFFLEKIIVLASYILIYYLQVEPFTKVKLLAFSNTLIFLITLILYIRLYVVNFQKHSLSQINWEEIKS